jgi:hypothetical protein
MSEDEEIVHFGVERTDVHPLFPTLVGVGALLMVGVTVLLTTYLVHNPWVQPEVPTPSMLSPAPQAPYHLEVDPKNRLIALRERAERRLTSYGWVDRKAGIVHIPIERAMDLVAKEHAAKGKRSAQGGKQ